MIALAALLLAAQPTSPRPITRPAPARSAAPRPDAKWLTGIWVQQTVAGSASLDECASWDALFYRADSTFAHGEREGFWVLRGNRVYELDRSPDSVPADELLSSAVEAAVVVRVSPDRMRKLLTDGKSATFLRCPSFETPVAR
jgi:hypothetical protein